MAEDILWNLADQEFSLWQSGKAVDEKNDFTKILKSTFLVFRKRQKDNQAKYCDTALLYYKENIRNWRYLQSQVVHESRSLSNISDEEHEECVRQQNAQIKDISYPGKESEVLHFDNYHRYLEASENKKIIDGLLNGDQKAFNSLYETEFQKIVYLIERNSGDIEDAKDIFHDALVVLMEKIHKHEFDLTCSLGTYLWSISKNIWYSKLRKRNKIRNFLFNWYKIENTEIVILEADSKPDFEEQVTHAIEQLGDPCKQLLECFYYKNLDWDEIAASLGYSNAASARNQKYKCLERIRATVQKEFQ